MKKRSLLVAISVLLVFLVTGTVYAAVTDSLTILGKVVHSQILDVEFGQGPEIVIPRAGESVGLGSNRKTLSFNVVLVQPGDIRIISFRLVNTGNITAKLSNLTVNNPAATTGVVITWPPLNDVLITPGATTPDYVILIEWDINAYTAPSGNVIFSASVDYSQV